MNDNLDAREKALYEIMRQASYLPLHSVERDVIEDAASAAIRWIRALDPSGEPSE